MRPQVGQVISNKYRLIRLIGDGGMGSVYEARHEGLGTTVALKFLHPELSRRSGLVQRFLQEARVSAQIQSPHVVRVSDVDPGSGGLAFIVMEYLEGRTLQTLYEDLYKAGERLAYADALEYAMQMLEGVEAAHRAGIVHRDLKPDNVIITKTPKGDPLLKLLDFGIAKLRVTGQLDRGLTRPGVIMGTPEYMAPEQAYSADAVDARADIFSLGVMIFEMLAGRRPVGGDDPHQIASSYISGQISKLSDLAPSLAPELCAAVHRAMAPQAADRFPAVHDFRDALDPFARAAKAPSAMTPTPAPAASKLRASDPVPAAIPPTSAGAGPASSPDGAAAAGASPAPDHGPSAVPKTIPPEEDGHAPVAAVPAAAPTPLGGFAADAGSSAASSPGVTSEPQLTPPPARAASPGIAAGAGLPSTVSAAPYAAPNGAHGGSTEAAPIDVSPRGPRPGGTAVGMPLFADPADARRAPSPGFGGTAPMDPLPATVSAAPYGGAPATARAGKSGPPLLLILLLAAGIAGAAVGGVYIAHEIGRTEEQADVPPPPPPPAATLPAEPQPPTTSAADPTAPATTRTLPPKPTSTPPKPTTTTTPPKPTTTPPPTTTTTPTPPPTTTTTPAPTTTTSPIPTLPPIILPSTFPFPIPITPPSNRPPHTPPTATTTTSKRPGIPILIPH